MEHYRLHWSLRHERTEQASWLAYETFSPRDVCTISNCESNHAYLRVTFVWLLLAFPTFVLLKGGLDQHREPAIWRPMKNGCAIITSRYKGWKLDCCWYGRRAPGRDAVNRIDLRLMRAAVVVAEELNFSRAAQRLHVSQPGLTKQIQDLEAALCVSLFIRDRQKVYLTEAGRAFVEESRLALMHQERAIRAATSAAKGAEASLNLGQAPSVDPLLISVMTSIHLPLFPELRIHITSGYAPELVRRVASGEIEIALALAFPESPQLTQVEVTESPLYVLIPEGSKLAAKAALSLQDLGQTPWMLLSRQIQPSLYDAIDTRARSIGFAGNDRHDVTSAEHAAQLMYKTGGAAILSKHDAWRVAMDGLTIRPLDEPEISMRTVLVVRNETRRVVNELVRATIRKVKNLIPPRQRTLPLAG
jgi:DNA-binding transcriptional LysR family regulator